MIKDCPMRSENGNCIAFEGSCAAVKSLETVCEALQNAYKMGYTKIQNSLNENRKVKNGEINE